MPGTMQSSEGLERRPVPLTGNRVLIVEDEYFLADDLSQALRKAGAEPVGPVSSVERADEAVISQGIDAAIIDLNLHGDMAFDFAERLALTRLPFLIVSGYGGDALPEALVGLPHLEKPVDPDRVIARLANEVAKAKVG